MIGNVSLRDRLVPWSVDSAVGWQVSHETLVQAAERMQVARNSISHTRQPLLAAISGRHDASPTDYHTWVWTELGE